jgi:hypothetical protein
MRRLLWALVVAAATWIPSRLSAQRLAEASVLQRPHRGVHDSVSAGAHRDTTVTDTRPSAPASIALGSMAWYPGALIGLLFTADAACFDGPCSTSSRIAVDVGVVGGGGLFTGLVVGAIARTSPGCTRSRALRAALLGAEVGSFGTAAATSLLNARKVSSVPAFAAVAVPVASAALATVLTRRCLRG